jgi:hypothetical protein
MSCELSSAMIRFSQQRVSKYAVAIAAILLFGLVGALFPHHETAADADECSYCHAGILTPIADLARLLAAPFRAAIAYLDPTPPAPPASLSPRSTLIPRAPPASTHPALFWEGCAASV